MYRFLPLPAFVALLSYVRASLVGDIGARTLSVVLGGYPKFTGRFSKLPGPYAVSFERARVGDCEAQILYPARDGTGRPGRYARPEIPAGLADFSSMPRFLFRPLSARRHPCAEGGDPADVPGGAPVVIFSHGLGGCAEMYTGLCASLASYGIVVCAVEHQDGSGSFARTAEGEIIPYKRYDGPKNTNFTRELVVNFRAPFLQQRISEVFRAMEHVMAETSGPFSKADKERVHLLGHSFGAATMILVAQQFMRGNDGCQLGSVGSVSLMDAWLTPLDNEVVEKGVSPPLLHVLSETWCKGPEHDAALRLSRASQPQNAESPYQPAIFAASQAQHASFSDAPNWYPGLLSKKFGIRGKEEKLYATHREVALLVKNAISCSVLSCATSNCSVAKALLEDEETEQGIRTLDLIRV